MTQPSTESLVKIRTVTTFVQLDSADFLETSSGGKVGVEAKISQAAEVGRRVRRSLEEHWEIQTLRIATNPFPEWIASEGIAGQAGFAAFGEQLKRVDAALQQHSIDFCSLGPALNEEQLKLCPRIVSSSPRFACSALLEATDTNMAAAAAQAIKEIGALHNPNFVQNGLGNFRFCVASGSSKDYIPFFPIARSASSSTCTSAACDGDGDVGSRKESTETKTKIRFAIGLENGRLAADLLSRCKSLRKVPTTFRTEFARSIRPIHELCRDVVASYSSDDVIVEFLGIDTSLNPSLDDEGSVATAIERLDEVGVFGGPGTLAAAAAITDCLQSFEKSDDIQLCGYCGLMLPLCEDKRLAQLANDGAIGISDLLCISQVCGVGIDTVPVSPDCPSPQLASLLLDVAGSAQRWGKSLSCRVFPVPGKRAGDMTTFDFPHLTNSRVLPLSSSPRK